MRRKLGWAAVALALALTIGPRPAAATGVMRVQQSSGSVQVYDDVRIKVIRGKALLITSPHGHGTLIADNGACSYVGDILRCLLFGLSLRQNGTTHALDFERGTVYFNFTSDWVNLPNSSQKVRPHGITMAFKTVKGTYVSVHGSIDETTTQ